MQHFENLTESVTDMAKRQTCVTILMAMWDTKWLYCARSNTYNMGTHMNEYDVLSLAEFLDINSIFYYNDNCVYKCE